MDINLVKNIAACLATLEKKIGLLYHELASKTRLPYNIVFQHIAWSSNSHMTIFMNLFDVDVLSSDEIGRRREIVGDIFVEAVNHVDKLIESVKGLTYPIGADVLRGIVDSLMSLESSASEEYISAMYIQVIKLNPDDLASIGIDKEVLTRLLNTIIEEEGIHRKMLEAISLSL